MPLIGNISDIGGQFDDFVKGINESRDALGMLQNQISGVAKTVSQNSQQISAIIDALTTTMAGLGKEAGGIVNALNGISSALKQDRQTVEHHAATIEDMWEVYKKMGVEVDKLSSDLKNLSFTEKEMNKVVQLGNTYNKERDDTYNSLSQKYRAIKILLDNMTEAEIKETAAGRQLLETSREIYQQMNLYQQSTGKYTLQVGDYSKAMNGLRISTNQVVRELPVLANGVSMFAIAISNNIPILMDSIVATKKEIDEKKKLQAEYLKAAEAAKIAKDAEAEEAAFAKANAIEITSVTKSLVSALFSWQTALVVVLAVLPGLIRKIQEKKKAQQEDNDATKEAIEYEKLLHAAMISSSKSERESVAELITLAHITQDVNRSLEDRLDAAKRLKQVYTEELSLYSAEDIAMGKAKTSIDAITEALKEQARARALMNKLTEAYVNQIDAEDKMASVGKTRVYEWAQFTGGTIEGLYNYIQEKMEQTNMSEDYLKKQIAFVAKGDKDVWERYEEYKKARQEMLEYGKTIDDLASRIPVGGLLKETANDMKEGEGTLRTVLQNIPNYYYELMESIINLTEDGFDRELELFDLNAEKQFVERSKQYDGLLEAQQDYEGQISTLEDAVAKEKDAKKREQYQTELDAAKEALQQILVQQRYMEDLMLNEETANGNARVKLVKDIEERRKEQLRKGVRDELTIAKNGRDAEAYQQYESSKRTIEDKKALDAALRDSERQYWEQYLADLREQGLLTDEIFNEIMNRIANSAKEAEDKVSKRGHRRNRFSGVFEAGMAMFTDWGQNDKDTGVRVLKDEYKDFATAVDNALKTSMKYMDEWMAKRLEMAEIAVEAAEKEVEAAKTALDYELEARNQGYANSVETARKELDIQRQNHKKALEEKAKVEEQQRMIDTATQISSLVTATANIWSAYTKAGMLGPFLAAAATAAMWGAFAAAQTKAAQVTKMKSQQYGEGTVELLEGGSHASGHDIDMGVAKDGTRRRAEGGEFFAIINKRNSRKYRKIIPDVINSFNDGTFGEKYYNANAAMGDFALGLLAGGSPTDVSKLERDVRAIREQGDENRYVDSRGNMVIRYKNLTRKYRKG